MDTLLYVKSIPLISSLQVVFRDQADFMQLMSVVFDPKYAFLIYSPIAYLIDHKLGKKLILTTVIAEWLNMILKWLFHGERPYWYVHSSGHFNPEEVPIEQFPITCELGPGHPSGHAMLTAAVWYTILEAAVQAYNKHLIDNNIQANYLRPFKLTIWSSFVLLLITVSVSRVFLGCHFPHQCLAGAILGILVARFVSRLETSARHFIGASIIMLTSAFGTFLLLQALGFDPAWTIKLATTHCVKREYIHLDTAPFFSIMRYCGFALGCGIALLLPSMKDYLKRLIPVETQSLLDLGAEVESSSSSSDPIAPSKIEEDPFSSRNVSWFSAKVLTALLMARLVDNLAMFVSQSNLIVFYLTAFVAYTGFSFTFINL